MILNINKNLKKSLLVASIALGLSACDSSSDSSTPDVTIENTTPVFTSTALIVATENSSYSYTATATDVDNDTLTMSSSTLPSWLSFDASTGHLSGTPSASDAGDHAITLTVNDGSVAVNQVFTLTVTTLPVASNTAPVITSTEITAATENTAYNYSLVATDADNDTLSMSVSGLPTWLSFNDSTGVLTGTPITADIGDHPLILTVNDGTTDMDQAFTITVSAEAVVLPELVIFENAALPNWAAWDCCGSSTPTVETDADADYDQVTQFSVLADTVNGFTARDIDGAVGGTVFNATSIATTGTISFDLKMTAAPNAGVVDWKLKIENNNGATFAEVNLSSSQEGHTTPVLDTWQTYTFNIADLTAAGLDVSSIDVVMVFPAWGSGVGAVYSIDNVKFFPTGATTSNNNGGGTTTPSGLATIDFETGGVGTGFSWNVFENDDDPALEIVANPASDSINDSATVAKITARVTGAQWVGTESAHGDFGPMTLDATNSTVKIMVYKTVISDVGVKFAIASGGAQPEIKVANTLVNQWEELTFNFSSQIGTAESINIDQIIVFPDFQARATENIVYFDNISFSSQ